MRRGNEQIEDHRLWALIDELKDLTCEAVDALMYLAGEARKMSSRIEGGETISQDEIVAFLKDVVAAQEGKKNRPVASSEAQLEPK